MNSRLISQEGPEVHSGHHFPWLFLLHSACSCLLSFSQLVEGKSILSVNQAQTLTVSITLLFFFHTCIQPNHKPVGPIFKVHNVSRI